MKHILLLSIALFAVCAFGVYVLVGTNETNETGLAFEDGTLSSTDRSLIVEDIQRVLSTGGKEKLKPYDDAAKHDAGMKGRISVGPKGHHWPRAFWENDFGEYRIDKKTSKRELVVPKKLIEAYREAIEIKNNHPEAFANLQAFVKEINKGYHSEKMDLSEKKSLFWFPPGMPAWSKEKYYDDNLREMKTISFNHPSLLTFQEAQVGNDTVLYCNSLVRSKKDDSLDQMVFVYAGSKWRIRAF